MFLQWWCKNGTAHDIGNKWFFYLYFKRHCNYAKGFDVNECHTVLSTMDYWRELLQRNAKSSFFRRITIDFYSSKFCHVLTKSQHHFAGIKMNPSILKKCHCNWRLLIKYCEPKSNFKFSSSHYLFSGFPVI